MGAGPFHWGRDGASLDGCVLWVLRIRDRASQSVIIPFDTHVLESPIPG